MNFLGPCKVDCPHICLSNDIVALSRVQLQIDRKFVMFFTDNIAVN